jgi:CHASE2 domain-containing sensor protein
MIRTAIIIIIIIQLIFSCKVPNLEPASSIDPNIVLVNLEEIDRAAIGKLLLSIDSCKPAVIGIKAYFLQEKGIEEDSILRDALRKIKNDLLIYSLVGDDFKHSHSKFREYVSGEGLNDFSGEGNMITHMIPISKIGNRIHESFALEIIKLWKPGFKSKFKSNEAIPIKYTRNIDRFFHFTSAEVGSIDSTVIKNKVVIVSYLGPTREDKYFTPLRYLEKYPEKEPDTYGAVIVANAVRTILDYDKNE